jgi:transposase
VIDLFVDELDLGGLGFGGVAPEATGRPAYHPAVLLKLYIYGYLNRVQSTKSGAPRTENSISAIDLLICIIARAGKMILG